MDRAQAIALIVDNEIKNLSIDDRTMLIYNIWGIDEGDQEFEELSEELKEEILTFDEPQYDVMLPRYDKLVRFVCELSYSQYSNNMLETILQNLLNHSVRVEGDEAKKYPCPCCGKMTLGNRGEYDICSLCGWEDDGIEEGNRYSTSNHMTLIQGQTNFLLYGKCDGGKVN